jgi:hypothetical protein
MPLLVRPLQLLQLLLVLCSGQTAQRRESESVVALDVDWPAFLGRHDPLWRWSQQLASEEGPPSSWEKSLFGGNAMLGFMLWQPDNQTVRIDIGRADLYDDRTQAATPQAFTGDFVYDRPRLPIGHFIVQFSAPLTSASGRLGLWDAEAQYNVSTGGSAATTTLRIWASADHELADALVLELGGTERPAVRWVAEPGDSFWMARTLAKSKVPCASRNMAKCACGNRGVGYGLCKSCPHGCGSDEGCVLCNNYVSVLTACAKPKDKLCRLHSRDCRGQVPNPTPRTTSTTGDHGTLNVTTQPHLRGTAHSTAVLELSGRSAFVVSVSPVSASAAAADVWASSQVTAAAAAGIERVRTAHRAWWHAFWPAGGFLTYEYTVLESLFFLMQYKFASAARRGRAFMDLNGPWLVSVDGGTNAPDVHWDWNIQG